MCLGPSRSKSLAIVVLASCVFVVAVRSDQWGRQDRFGTAHGLQLAARTTIELTGAMVSEIFVLILPAPLPQAARRAAAAIGLGSPRRARRWIAAAAVAILFTWFNLALPLRGQPGLAELSLFRIYNRCCPVLPRDSQKRSCSGGSS